MDKSDQARVKADSQISTGRRDVLKTAWTIPAVIALGSIPAFARQGSGGTSSSSGSSGSP